MPISNENNGDHGEINSDIEAYVHPSKDIVGTKSNLLKGKLICLCVTGSVAIINSVSLAREFMRHGAEVVVVMSKEAQKLITPEMFKWATGNKVISELSGDIEHIVLAGERPGKKGKADIILVAPATANTISKIACGIDDTPVTTVVTTAFGSATPMVIVPAMHESMFNHPILKENIQKLKSLNVDFIMPNITENKAKISENDEIVEFIIDKLRKKKDLEGLNFLVTAGPTREFIDRVRYISNPSTGRMGIEIAKEIASRGGNVKLILGKTYLKPPNYIDCTYVISAKDFFDNVLNEVSENHYDVFISAAAIADFTPDHVHEEKIDSSIKHLEIKLKSTPKIIDAVRNINKEIYIVAFKAETNLDDDALIDKAYNRMKRSNLQMIVANNVFKKERGFESLTNEIYIISDKNGEKEVIHVGLASKRDCAEKIIDTILKNLKSFKT
ncbi:MAG: bifunctional phosphopantothenoylcysteine decarboxylase/phosphopantothenate--cysteine ligase CoaBC [Promethearchaeota archaeon]